MKEPPAREAPFWIRHSNFGFALTLILVALGFLVYQVIVWPPVGALATERPETTAFIQRFEASQHGAEHAKPLEWIWIPYDSISIDLKRAVVAAEDISFFSHNGFAVDEIRDALSDAVSGGGGLRGASTITQQVAKNLWLTPSRNPLRKVKEALLTRQLEKHLSKWRILETYLNVAELGTGIYGAEAAARHYFDKSAAELDEHEAAQLAASLPRPASWHPGSDSDGYSWYVAEIERRMERATFLRRRVSPP